jgi:predicted nicotinamide N-methyase
MLAKGSSRGESGPAASEDLAAVTAVRRKHLDPVEFIKVNLPLTPVPTLPDIRLHMAHPASGLFRLVGQDQNEADLQSPYWAYNWAGGAALAHYFRAHPETVTCRRVLDLGAGSGIVGIAAAKAGASEVIAAEVDPYALAVLPLNAAANGVAITIVATDLTAASPPPADIVAVGDLFYDRDLADRVLAFLDRCLAAGMTVLVGDPGRAYLPRSRLRLLAEYPVPDFGDVKGTAMTIGAVFMLKSA